MQVFMYQLPITVRHSVADDSWKKSCTHNSVTFYSNCKKSEIKIKQMKSGLKKKCNLMCTYFLNNQTLLYLIYFES
jgi:hypothetical protein